MVEQNQNPTAGVAPEKLTTDRDRTLSDAEIAAFWDACDKAGWIVGPVFRLLLLTGARCAEIGELRWSELDLTNRVINLPGARVKNKKAHTIHLNDLAWDILSNQRRINGSKYVFTNNGDVPFCSYDHGKHRLQALMGIVEGAEALPWTPHDLRRTVASKMAALGVEPYIIEKVLNHQPAAIRGVAAIYNRHQYLEQRKAALEKLGDHIAQLTGANVVKLRA